MAPGGLSPEGQGCPQVEPVPPPLRSVWSAVGVQTPGDNPPVCGGVCIHALCSCTRCADRMPTANWFDSELRMGLERLKKWELSTPPTPCPRRRKYNISS